MDPRNRAGLSSIEENEKELLREQMMQTCSCEDFINLMNSEAPSVPCDSCTPSQIELEAPPWFDEKLFTRGRKFILKNFTGQLVACLCGLITVLSIPNSFNILIHTNKSSTTLSAYRRYLSTILHLYAWLRSDLQPGSVGWKSLSTVRKRHLRASNRSQSNGIGMISQRDLVITLFGFFGYAFLKPQKIGMVFENDDDKKSYLHFWRTIGFMVGIHDKYNFCEGSLNEVKQKMEYICEEICMPHLSNPPEYFFHMVKAMLDGMFLVTIFIGTKPFLYFTYKLNEIPGFVRKKFKVTMEEDEYEITNEIVKRDNNFNKIENVALDGERFLKSMTKMERRLLICMLVVFEKLIYTSVGRWFYNCYFHLTFLLLQYVPYMAILQYGIRSVFVNIFAEDIAIPTKMMTNKEVLDKLYQKNKF